jgi:amino acid transporter
VRRAVVDHGCRVTSPAPAAPRILGRSALVALVLNSIIGSGVFVLPGTIGGRLGWGAVPAWIAGAAIIALCVAAFAEVSSRFESGGGPYRYAHAAFGPLIGIEVAWLVYFARTLSAAAQANLFTTALGEFWPWSASRAGALTLTTLFIVPLAFVNVRGTRGGARTSSLFAMIKVGALLLLGLAGCWWLTRGAAVTLVPPSDATPGGWFSAMLLLAFAYGGFEGAMIPLGEARDPRRDAPFALITGFIVVVIIYLLVQVAVLATVADPGATPRPLASSARTMAGTPGAIGATLLVVASVTGWMAASMLNMPRMTVAMAHDGMLPAALARRHSTFGTPVRSIALFAALSWMLALSASLLQNVSLSAVARLLAYGVVCAAMVRFRQRERAGRFTDGVRGALLRVPAGTVVGGLGCVLIAGVLLQTSAREAASVSVVIVCAALHWWRTRGARGRADQADSSSSTARRA